jgi:hypothetical protein
MTLSHNKVCTSPSCPSLAHACCDSGNWPRLPLGGAGCVSCYTTYSLVSAPASHAYEAEFAFSARVRHDLTAPGHNRDPEDLKQPAACPVPPRTRSQIHPEPYSAIIRDEDVQPPPDPVSTTKNILQSPDGYSERRSAQDRTRDLDNIHAILGAPAGLGNGDHRRATRPCSFGV